MMWRCALLVLALLGVTSRPASAGPDDIDMSNVYDGGAIPLFYLPLAGNLLLRHLATVRREPLLFDDDDLGHSRRRSAIPHWALFASAGALGSYMLWSDDSRYIHLKGLAQTLVLTTTTTQVLKYGFGRRRPWFKVGTRDGEQARKSFVSGHASTSGAIAAYASLYLRYQGFDRFRSSGWTWWEVATYGGLAGLALYVPYRRVRDKHHHLGDVIAGTALGVGIAGAVFFYQQGRYDEANETGFQSFALPLFLTRRF